MNRFVGSSLVVVAFCGAAIALAGAPREGRPAVNPKTATLPQAVADWVDLLEKNDPKAAAERWTVDQKATKSMGQFWESLRALHRQFDYRSWLEKRPANAAGIGDGKRFTVGGHDFGHVHVVWAKTDAGWRIEDVFACR